MKKIVLIALILFSGCTANQRVRSFGGTSTIELQKNEKFVNITWKDTNLWILTRPMREDESPEEYKFKCNPEFGVLEGQVIIKESR